MTTVIHHSADFDGIFCREIARHFLGDNDVTYIGWNFGDPPIEIPMGPIYVMDLPIDSVFGFDYSVVGNVRGPQHPAGLVWIDHHKTSIESHPTDIPGYRIDGVAACRLAWQWFATYNNKRNPIADHFATLPTKQEFINHKVTEPLAVRLAGEYDIWDKRDPRAETFQYALRVEKEPDFDKLLSESYNGRPCTAYLSSLLSKGEVAEVYAKNTNESICKSLTWLMEWEGLKFLCVNHARFNSLLFAAKDTPETGHDALLGFRFDGKTWMVSLYHAKHRTDIDLSAIAKKYGGGGHRGACGFTCKTLPFTL